LAKEVTLLLDEKEEIETETAAKQTLLDSLKPKLESLLEVCFSSINSYRYLILLIIYQLMLSGF